MESFNEQKNRENRQNATLRKWGLRNGLTNAEIETRIQKAHAARGSRNASLAINAIKRKIGGSRKRGKTASKRLNRSKKN